MWLAPLAVVRIGALAEDPDVQIDEFVRRDVPDDWHRQRLLRREVADVLSEFHYRWMEPAGLE
jgi:hypothetical protein